MDALSPLRKLEKALCGDKERAGLWIQTFLSGKKTAALSFKIPRSGKAGFVTLGTPTQTFKGSRTH